MAWFDKLGFRKAGSSQRGGPVIPFIPLIASGVSVLGGLMANKNSGGSSQAAPEVSTPTVMPTEDTKLTQDAKRRALVAQQQRGGRTSTILSETDNNTFGGN